MDRLNPKQLMMVGLPSSGKTTFLAAFWYMVDQLSSSCSLTVDKLEGDRKYLNQIRDSWLEFKPVPRNSVDSQKLVSMALRTTSDGGQITLKIPDLSGEMFRQQWSKRQLTVGYNELLQGSQGALLFIGPDISKAHRIDMLDELSNMVPDAAGPGDGKAITPKSWDIERAPTQVQLIELLQTIATRDYIKPGFKLAVLVSAWDLHREAYKQPDDFVSNELPILDQFLRSNSHFFKVMNFGVSAQGGLYASPMLLPEMFKNLKDLEKLLIDPPNDLHSWLAKAIDPATMKALQDPQQKEVVSDLLARDFNVLLGKRDLYDKTRFTSITLKPETESFLEEFLEKENRDDTELKMLNRKLLEEAFPKSLSTKWQNRTEHQKLANLPASQRVSIVGKSVKDEHDITEPIQWLMS